MGINNQQALAASFSTNYIIRPGYSGNAAIITTGPPPAPAQIQTNPLNLTGGQVASVTPVVNATQVTAPPPQAPPPPPTTQPSICCLVEDGNKCMRPAGNASYSKRIEKQVAQRKMQLVIDPRVSHTYICEYHKQIIQSIRASNKRKRKEEENMGGGGGAGAGEEEQSMDYTVYENYNDPINAGSGNYNKGNYSGSNNFNGSSSQEVSLHVLQMGALRKYKKHFQISTKQGINKNQLAEELNRHFRSLRVQEKEVIETFIKTIKNNLKHEN